MLFGFQCLLLTSTIQDKIKIVVTSLKIIIELKSFDLNESLYKCTYCSIVPMSTANIETTVCGRSLHVIMNTVRSYMTYCIIVSSCLRHQNFEDPYLEAKVVGVYDQEVA